MDLGFPEGAKFLVEVSGGRSGRAKFSSFLLECGQYDLEFFEERALQALQGILDPF